MSVIIGFSCTVSCTDTKKKEGRKRDPLFRFLEQVEL